MIQTASSSPSSFGQSPAFETLFEETIHQVQQSLAGYLVSSHLPVPVLDQLWEAMRYGVLQGGKRLRPVLAIETCLACGGSLEAILPTACAIEFVHAQSLIHDDLPCMDNDDLRRGKPTLHKAYDEATAVLTGDALLAMAFGLITQHTPLSPQITPTVLCEIITEFSQVASIQGLVGGQYVDIYYEGKPYTEDVLECIHSYKTGALMTFSVRSGAKLAGTSPLVVETLTQVGQKLGLAFQIVDDLLDIQSTSEALGKTPGKDQAQQKATYPAYYGEKASRQKVAQLIQESHQQLDAIASISVARLKVLTTFMETRIH